MNIISEEELFLILKQMFSLLGINIPDSCIKINDSSYKNKKCLIVKNQTFFIDNQKDENKNIILKNSFHQEIYKSKDIESVLFTLIVCVFKDIIFKENNLYEEKEINGDIDFGSFVFQEYPDTISLVLRKLYSLNKKTNILNLFSKNDYYLCRWNETIHNESLVKPDQIKPGDILNLDKYYGSNKIEYRNSICLDQNLNFLERKYRVIGIKNDNLMIKIKSNIQIALLENSNSLPIWKFINSYKIYDVIVDKNKIKKFGYDLETGDRLLFNNILYDVVAKIIN